MAAGVGTEGLEEPSCLTPVVIIGHSISAQMLTGGQSILNFMLPHLKMLFWLNSSLTFLSPFLVFQLLEFLFPLLLLQLLLMMLLLHLPVMLQQLLLMLEGQQVLLMLEGGGANGLQKEEKKQDKGVIGCCKQITGKDFSWNNCNEAKCGCSNESSKSKGLERHIVVIFSLNRSDLLAPRLSGRSKPNGSFSFIKFAQSEFMGPMFCCQQIKLHQCTL